MKLSDYTIKLLTNFISFNDGIVIRKGNIISTTTLAMNVAVIATVPDHFPVDCAIYDMRKFMALVSLFNSPDFNFGSHTLIISDELQKVELTYSDKDCIRYIVDQEFTYIEPIETFLLSKDKLFGILKALNILSNPELKIYGDGEKIYLAAQNSKISSSDTFTLEVGTTDKNFDIIIKAANLTMLPIDYEVSVSADQALFSSWNSDDENVKYYIATETQL